MWNIKGLASKDGEFWEYVTGFDVIRITETWMTEEQWREWKDKMPEQFHWGIAYATRKHKRGTPSGRIITVAKKNTLEEIGEMEGNEIMQERNQKDERMKNFHSIR